MITTGLCPKTFILDSVVRGLCVEGKVEKAMLVLVLVCRGRCGMIDGVTFDVLIDEMNRQGMARHATCVHCVALKNGVITKVV
ncbi:hypothetical protein OSB04_022973 [Centaurea solstitialis]|uniref:Uncharacterized protein n=1 Tax=Centaurea solstitialis TaxID=347529 RepID=A0AA38SV35_9ASTR|nr:hypothetical protein OSB04_022973 [Centaurea solstitialis]